MSTKPKTLKEQIPGHEKELAKAGKRLRKKRRITRQIRVNDRVATDLKEQSKREKRTMSRLADELITDGIRSRKSAWSDTARDEEKAPIKPFPHLSEFRDL